MAIIRLKQMLKLAYQRKYIEEDLTLGIVQRRDGLPDIDPLSLAEQAMFLEAVAPHWRPYFIVAFATGMRPGEQVALEWGDIDYRRDLIYIRRQYVRGQLKNP